MDFEQEELDKLKEDNKRLKQRVRKLEKEIKKYKSNAKTVESVWQETENYLMEVTKGVSLEEILKTIRDGKPLDGRKVRRKCTICGLNTMKKIQFDKFYVAICNCGHREKVDEETS